MHAPALYLAAFERLARKQIPIEGTRADLLRSSFSKLARQLQREVEAGSYRFRPLTPFDAYVGGKVRRLHRAEGLDYAVLWVLSRRLSRIIEPQLAPACHSYRRGHSQASALRSASRFLRRHRAEHCDPRARGVYAVRCDIASYGESIRVDADSPLWSALEHAVPEAALLGLVRGAILQPILDPQGGSHPSARGVPTGSPIQPPLCNLYLNDLDHKMMAIGGLFYSRFGDDLLLSHPDRAVLESTLSLVEKELFSLGLRMRSEKSVYRFLNAAGRPPPESDTCYKGAPFLDYLGARLHFAGGFSFPRAKRRALVQGIRSRVHAVVREQSDALPLEERCRELCQVVRRSLMPTDCLGDPQAADLFLSCTNHVERVRFARDLEVIVAQACTKTRGRRAFRLCPPQMLRAQGFPRLDRPGQWMEVDPIE